MPLHPARAFVLALLPLAAVACAVGESPGDDPATSQTAAPAEAPSSALATHPTRASASGPGAAHPSHLAGVSRPHAAAATPPRAASGAPAPKTSGGVSPDTLITPSPEPGYLGFTNDSMTGTVHLYFLLYGDWSDSAFSPEVPYQLAGDLWASSYMGVLQSWTDVTFINGPYPANYVAYETVTGQVLLDDQGVQSVISGAFQNSENASFGWAPDPNGIYIVLAGDNVNLIDAGQDLDFCSNMCAYHQSFSYGGTAIKYAWIGNPSRCGAPTTAGGCYPAAPYVTNANAPHKDVNGDSMAYQMTHEVMEAITDPYPNSNIWGEDEIADVCETEMPQLYYTNGGSTGTIANVTMFPGTTTQNSYILPSIEVHQGTGYCATAMPSAPSCSFSHSCIEVGEVGISCSGEATGDVSGVVNVERDGVIVSQTQADNTVYPTWGQFYDTTAGTHTWQVCTENGGGGPTECTSPETYTNLRLCRIRLE